MNNPMEHIYTQVNNYIKWLQDMVRTINPGDLVDRLTIVYHKRERLDSEHYKAEFMIYENAILAILNRLPPTVQKEVALLYEEIKSYNGNIWDLEEDIRMNREAVCADLEEVGRRTLQIRDINDMRVKARNKINRLIGSHFEELKSCQKNFDKEVVNGEESSED